LTRAAAEEKGGKRITQHPSAASHAREILAGIEQEMRRAWWGMRFMASRRA
jgi:hypothetical protein